MSTGSTSPRSTPSEDAPPLAARALEEAARLGFTRSSIPEVGRLLRVLAAGRRAAEIGTGVGVGAAWLADTAESVVTVEIDAELAAAARRVLAGAENVTVMCGDWEALLPLAPFDLVFLDGGPKQAAGEAARTLELVEPGGLFVLDDLTPGSAGGDPVREFWLGDGRVAGVELLTTPETAAIVAVRR